MRSGRRSATFGTGDAPASTTAQVKAAMVAATANPRTIRGVKFSFDKVTPREAAVAPLLGIYLGFSVARLHERFPVLQVPNLLFGLMAIMLITLMAAVPKGGWKTVWKSSLQVRLVAVLLGLAFVTAPLGIWAAGSLNYLVTRYSIAIGVYIACLFLLRDRKVLRRVVILYVAITTLVACVNVYNYFNGDFSNTLMTRRDLAVYEQSGVLNAERARQGLGSLDPNDLAAVLATTFPLALWLAIGNLRRRVIWTSCAIVLIVGVVPTSSRGGLLGLAAAAIVLVLVGARGGKRVFLVGSMALGAFAFMTLAGSQMDRLSEFGTNDYNYTTSEGRIGIWKRGIVWMIKRPWGYGLENFPLYFGWLNGPDRAAHNSLIQYGVELGVLGLFVYLLATWTLITSLLKVRSHALNAGRAGQETVALCGHVLAVIAASFTSGFFLSHAYYPLTYMAIGIGSAVVLSATETIKQAAPVAASVPSGPAGRRRRYLKAFEAA